MVTLAEAQQESDEDQFLEWRGASRLQGEFLLSILGGRSSEMGSG